jgi:hypothetical protein
LNSAGTSDEEGDEDIPFDQDHIEAKFPSFFELLNTYEFNNGAGLARDVGLWFASRLMQNPALQDALVFVLNHLHGIIPPLLSSQRAFVLNLVLKDGEKVQLSVYRPHPQSHHLTMDLELPEGMKEITPESLGITYPRSEARVESVEDQVRKVLEGLRLENLSAEELNLIVNAINQKKTKTGNAAGFAYTAPLIDYWESEEGKLQYFDAETDEWLSQEEFLRKNPWAYVWTDISSFKEVSGLLPWPVRMDGIFPAPIKLLTAEEMREELQGYVQEGEALNIESRFSIQEDRKAGHFKIEIASRPRRSEARFQSISPAEIAALQFAPESFQVRIATGRLREAADWIYGEVDRNAVAELRQNLTQPLRDYLNDPLNFSRLLARARGEAQAHQIRNLQQLSAILDSLYAGLERDFPDRKVPLALDYDVRIAQALAAALKEKSGWVNRLIFNRDHVRGAILPEITALAPSSFTSDLNHVLNLEENGFGYVGFNPLRKRLDRRITHIRNEGDLAELDELTLRALLIVEILLGIQAGLGIQGEALKATNAQLFKFFSPETFQLSANGTLSVVIRSFQQDLMSRRLESAA